MCSRHQGLEVRVRNFRLQSFDAESSVVIVGAEVDEMALISQRVARNVDGH